MTDDIYKRYDDGNAVGREDAEELCRLADEIIERGKFECHAEFKNVDGEKRVIEGYANTKELDRYYDIIEPTAFEKSLDYYLKNGPVLSGHRDMQGGDIQVVGTPINGSINSKGFRLKAQILTGLDPTDPIERVWNVIKQGGLKAFSVGFAIAPDGYKWHDKADDDPRPRLRTITEVDLYEVSVVAVPANKGSLFSLTKGFLLGSDMPQCERRDDLKGDRVVTPEQANNELEAYDSLREYAARIGETIEALSARERDRRVDAAVERIDNYLRQGE
jgi:HK97 family phage prohead protease